MAPEMTVSDYALCFNFFLMSYLILGGTKFKVEHR